MEVAQLQAVRAEQQGAWQQQAGAELAASVAALRAALASKRSFVRASKDLAALVCRRSPSSLPPHDSIQIFSKFRTISPTFNKLFPQVARSYPAADAAGRELLFAALQVGGRAAPRAF
jgi:hypothetical protein